MENEKIDLTDIQPSQDWDKAVVGKFYRPIPSRLLTPADPE